MKKADRKKQLTDKGMRKRGSRVCSCGVYLWEKIEILPDNMVRVHTECEACDYNTVIEKPRVKSGQSLQSQYRRNKKYYYRE